MCNDETDSIELFVPSLTQEYADTNKKIEEVSVSSTFENMDTDAGDWDGKADVKLSRNFLAYPLNFAGATTHGQVMVPEIGDEVLCTFLDNDRSQLYYQQGSKKVEGYKDNNPNPKTLNLDFLAEMDFYDEKDSEPIKSALRHLYKVLYKSKGGSSLTFLDNIDLDNPSDATYTMLLKNVASYLRMHHGKSDEEVYIELMTGHDPSTNFGVMINKKEAKVELYNGEQGICIEYDEKGFIINGTETGVLNAPEITINGADAVNINTTNATVTASASVSIDSPKVEIGGSGAAGNGVITMNSICPFTGSPHSMPSTTVFAAS